MKSTPKYKASFFLFAGLPIIFFLLFGFDGMDASDRGFIPAFAYRICSGEAIYQDFYYVRPPLTPYLHTFEMLLFPESLEIVGYRFFFYVFVWLSVFFSVRALQKFFDFEKIGISPWLLGAIAYVLSVHNFFAAPWHTLDGVLFASLGIYLISRGPQLRYLVAGLFSMGLSAMTKQPFAIVPLLGLGLVFFLYPWKRALISLVSTVLLAGLCGALIEYLFTPNYSFFQKMVAQTTGVTSFEDMKWSAFKLYVRPGIIAFVPGAVVWCICKYWLRSPYTPMMMAALTFLGMLGMALGPLAITIQAGHFVMPKSGYYHGLLACGGMIAALTFLKRDRPGLFVVLAMLGVAWASGVSWGYATPVLYTLPALFSVAYFTGSIAGFHAPRWFWSAVFGICMASVGVLNLYVYDDAFRTEITYDLGEVFPKLSHLQAGEQQFNRYAELKSLHEKYGDAFTVLPSMPAAHYVTNTAPRIPADWVHDAEINYQFGIDQSIQILDQSHNVVFALKDEMHRANETGTFRCSVLKHVIDHWTLVDSTSEFWVYDNAAVLISGPD